MGSTLGATGVGVTGFAGGQLLTPPACSVLHQGQRIGSAFADGADGGAVMGSTGFALTAGSEVRSGTIGCLGLDGATGVGWAASVCGDGLAD